MKIISQNIIGENRCLVISTGKTVWKFPVSSTTWQEAGFEKRNVAAARKDLHFSLYLPLYKFLFNASRTPLLKELASHPEKEHLMKEYFQKAFASFHSWPRVLLKQLGDLHFFEDFVKTYAKEDWEFWSKILDKLSISQSSSHGDFHMDHIFFETERLYFIDWVLYEASSSRYFDLINFWIFSEKIDKESWIEVWKRNSVNPPRELFGIAISPTDYLAYAIWKVAVEVKLLSLRKRLDERKQKKYSVFVNDLGKVILAFVGSR